MTFKPLPWLSFFSALILSILLTLGFWQVDRYHEKIELIATLEAEKNKTSSDLEQLVNFFGKVQYRSFKLDGEFLSSNSIFLRGQYVINSRTTDYGFYVFTPYQFEFEGKQIQVMIDRGFIPEAAYGHEEAYKITELKQPIQAVVKFAEKQGSFLPDNVKDEDIWMWREVDLMNEKFSLKNPLPIYMSLQDEAALKAKSLPLPTKFEVKSANNHLSYFLTWFSLALGLVLLYVYYHIYNGRLYLNKSKSNQ